MAVHQTYLDTRTFGCLDGLRAFSITAVVWHHSCPPTAWAATGRGFLGVDLFFVISGFLIVTLLLRERDRHGRIALGAFYARRFLRIVPLNYFVILALLAATAWSGSGLLSAVQHDAPYAMTYTANWFPMLSMLAITWSLAAEEQFYVAWPLVERFRPRHANIIWAALVITSISLTVAHAHFGMLEGLPSMLSETTFVPILLGVGLARALHSAPGFKCINAIAGHQLAAPTILAVIVGSISIPSQDISGLPRLCLHLLFTLLLAACVVREDNGLRPLLANRALARIGTVSYGIYLLHHIGLHGTHKLIHGMAWPPQAIFAIAMLLTWGLAEVSFRTLERFFLSFKGRWSR